MNNNIIDDEVELFEYTVGYHLKKKRDTASAIADVLIRVSILKNEKNNVRGWLCGTYISHVKDALKRRVERKFTKEEFDLIEKSCLENEELILSQKNFEEKILYDEILKRLMKIVPFIRLNSGKRLVDYLEN